MMFETRQQKVITDTHTFHTTVIVGGTVVQFWDFLGRHHKHAVRWLKTNRYI